MRHKSNVVYGAGIEGIAGRLAHTREEAPSRAAQGERCCESSSSGPRREIRRRSPRWSRSARAGSTRWPTASCAIRTWPRTPSSRRSSRSGTSCLDCAIPTASKPGATASSSGQHGRGEARQARGDHAQLLPDDADRAVGPTSSVPLPSAIGSTGGSSGSPRTSGPSSSCSTTWAHPGRYGRGSRDPGRDRRVAPALRRARCARPSKPTNARRARRNIGMTARTTSIGCSPRTREGPRASGPRRGSGAAFAAAQPRPRSPAFPEVRRHGPARLDVRPQLVWAQP